MIKNFTNIYKTNTTSHLNSPTQKEETMTYITLGIQALDWMYRN